MDSEIFQMQNYIRVKILEFHPSFNESFESIFEKLAKNYSQRTQIDYQIGTVKDDPNQSPFNKYMIILFSNPETYFEIHSKEAKVLYALIQSWFPTQNKMFSKFDFLQQFNRICGGANHYYLSIQYETDMVDKMKEYYEFINKFSAHFDLCIFIDPYPDGFYIYFGRKEDFEYFVQNALSEEDVRAFSKKYNIGNEIDKIVELIRGKN